MLDLNAGVNGVAWMTAAISAPATRCGWASVGVGRESGRIQWAAQRRRALTR